jgi:hypothetical protein
VLGLDASSIVARVRHATPLRPLRGAPRGLRVFLNNPASLRNLQDFLRRAECIAEQCRSDELEVYVPGAPSDEQARRELNVYLATWQANNPGVEAYIVERGREGETPARG